MILLALGVYSYWDISNWKACGKEVLEDDQDIRPACISDILGKAEKGNKSEIYLYTRHLRLTVLDEIVSDKSFAIAMARQSTPTKMEYLHWVRIAAKAGFSDYVTESLELCQAGVPSFDKLLIKQIFEASSGSARDLTLGSTPTEQNNEKQQINALEKSWYESKFTPCNPEAAPLKNPDLESSD
ncbi:uncharacterized protein NMK_1577 [Novimethylophilus kurashikiensis]|uniref:Uncharacterized protein n=2 Tax=Novimethylophilus kurashikiensis TaxID=1825523 RepID=A0A2R5FBF7_9PROT|nr:uncharacterized protein NMK_1577 [Novimethylophilus kurashikiensis]